MSFYEQLADKYIAALMAHPQSFKRPKSDEAALRDGFLWALEIITAPQNREELYALLRQADKLLAEWHERL